MTRRLKVAHVLVPYIRPTETFIYDRLIHNERYDAFVMTDECAENTDVFPFKPIYSMARSPLAFRKLNTAVYRLSGFSPFYYKVIKNQNPDVVHAHYGPIGAAVSLTAEISEKPLVVSFYGIDASAFLSDRRFSESYRKLFKKAAVISAISKDMAHRLIEAGCPENKIRIHHLAVDVDTLRPSEDDKGEKPLKIVSVGRFVAKKGMIHLINSFSRAARIFPDAELHIFGEGPLEGEIRHAISENKMDEKIFMRGRKSRIEVLDAVRASSIFALFSITAPDGDKEGTPTVLIEAGALGVPVVSTMHAGIPEVVEDGVTGCLVEERDEEAFTNALVKLAQNPETRASMGKAARQKITNEFDIKSVIAEIESAYDQARG